MNKFYFKTFMDTDDFGLMSIYSYWCNEERDELATYTDVFIIFCKDKDIFYSMCKEPYRAIMYLNHCDLYIRRLAKVILHCKSSIEVDGKWWFMNKFYFTTCDAYCGNSNVNSELDIYVHFYDGSAGQINYYYWLVKKDQWIFYSMCETPTRALLYLKHDNKHICWLAELILKCKEPVKVINE